MIWIPRLVGFFGFATTKKKTVGLSTSEPVEIVALLLEKDQNASLLVFCIIYIYNKFRAPGTLKQPQPTHLHKMSWATQPDLSGPPIFPFAPFFSGRGVNLAVKPKGGKTTNHVWFGSDPRGGTIHQKCWDSRKSLRFRNFSPL